MNELEQLAAMLEENKGRESFSKLVQTYEKFLCQTTHGPVSVQVQYNSPRVAYFNVIENGRLLRFCLIEDGKLVLTK
jgi:hypothetical protein